MMVTGSKRSDVPDGAADREAKKPSVSQEASQEVSADVKLLRFQNKKLVQRMKKEKAELKRLRGEMEHVTNQLNNAEKSNMDVLQAWTALDRDTQLLLARVDPSEAVLNQETTDLLCRLQSSPDALSEYREHSLGLLEKLARHVSAATPPAMADASAKLAKLHASFTIQSETLASSQAAYVKLKTKLKYTEDELTQCRREIVDLQKKLDRGGDEALRPDLIREDSTSSMNVDTKEDAAVQENEADSGELVRLKEQVEELNAVLDVRIKSEKTQEATRSELEQALRKAVEEKERVEMALERLQHEQDELLFIANKHREEFEMTQNLLSSALEQKSKELEAAQKTLGYQIETLDKGKQILQAELAEVRAAHDSMEYQFQEASALANTNFARRQELEHLVLSQHEELVTLRARVGEKRLYPTESNQEETDAAAEHFEKEKQQWEAKRQNLGTLIEALQSKSDRSKAEMQVELSELKRLCESKTASIAQLESELQALKAESSVGDLQQELEAQKELNEYFQSEMEVIIKQHDETQEQNVRILAAQSELEDVNTSLVTEKVKTEHHGRLLGKQNSMLEQQTHKLEDKIRLQAEVIQDLQAKEAQLQENATIAAEQMKLMRSSSHELKRIAAESYARSESAVAAKSSAEKRLAKAREELEAKEKEVATHQRRLRRMEEKKAVAEKRLARIATADDIATEEELLSYKKTINCSVCNEREKSVIITRCFHMFCRDCIQKNLKSRHRKCPGCGKPFGEDDVHSIYLN